MTVQEAKKEIRKEIRKRKSEVPATCKEELSLVIQKKVMALEVISRASSILVYHSLPDEVNTLYILEELSSMYAGTNKRILLPVVTGEILLLKEYNPALLEKGYMQIMEPQNSETIDPSEVDLAIIPGIAFDSRCNRMGRGKGFYDRLLPHLNCMKIGLGFQFQIVDSIPCDSFDMPLDMVITEENSYIL